MTTKSVTINIKRKTLAADGDIGAHELVERMKETVEKYFPHSYIDCRFGTSLGASICLRFALGKDKSEWTNGIIQNDPAHNIIFVWGMDKEGNKTDKGYTLESSGFGLCNKNYKRNKLGWRDIKKPSDSSVILKGLDKAFSAMKKAVDEGYHTSTTATVASSDNFFDLHVGEKVALVFKSELDGHVYIQVAPLKYLNTSNGKITTGQFPTYTSIDDAKSVAKRYGYKVYTHGFKDRSLTYELSSSTIVINGDVANPEKLGSEIAKATQWDGDAIAEIFYHALVDANFHKEAAKIKKMFDLEV